MTCRKIKTTNEIHFRNYGLFRGPRALSPAGVEVGEDLQACPLTTRLGRKGFPLLNDCIIGDGFENVERCNDFWKIKSEIDLFVFSDIQHSGLQLELDPKVFLSGALVLETLWRSTVRNSIKSSVKSD